MAAAAGLERVATADGDHGRIGVRRHALRCDGDRPATDRRFPGLAAIAMVEATVERPGQGSRLHRVLDVVFRAGRRRRRTGHGPRTLAGVAPLAVTLLRAGSGRPSLEVRRRRAAWNVADLERLLRPSP